MFTFYGLVYNYKWFLNIYILLHLNLAPEKKFKTHQNRLVYVLIMVI